MRKLILVVLSIALLIGAISQAGTAAGGVTMHNCPGDGEWALSVWPGGDGADAEEALASCGNIQVAYALKDGKFDARYIEGAFEGVNTLDTLDNMEAVVALGVGAPVIVEPEVEALYPDRRHSNELPNLANDAAHSLTKRMRVVGGGGSSWMPELPEAVVQVGNGDVLAIWTDRRLPAATEICFYWDGVPLTDTEGKHCVAAPKAHGSGHIYNIEVLIGADQTYQVLPINHDYQYWYCGRDAEGDYRYCRVSSADSIPFNPTCPFPARWELHPDQPPTCPGHPEAEFGAYRCANPPPGKQYCNFFDR